MRSGLYGVYKGKEYGANHSRNAQILLFSPGDEPCPPGWWRESARRDWRIEVPVEELDSFYQVRTSAKFEGIRVGIHDLYDDGTAWLYYQGSPDKEPLHPAFKSDPDPGVSQWYARESQSKLSEIIEEITYFKYK